MSLTIKLKPSELVELVKANQSKFIENYKIALEGYFEELNTYANALKKCAKDKVIPSKLYPPQIPQDHIDDYDTVVSMIDADKSDLIEITQHDYQKYVLDRWDWKDMWELSNSKYFTK